MRRNQTSWKWRFHRDARYPTGQDGRGWAFLVRYYTALHRLGAGAKPFYQHGPAWAHEVVENRAVGLGGDRRTAVAQIVRHLRSRARGV